MDKIKVGEYIVVQRQDFTKLQRFDNLTTTVTLGRDIVELKNIEGHDFFKTFKMKLKEIGSKKKRLYELELCDNVSNVRDILKSFESGSDNRNLIDSQETNQNLTLEEIESIRTKTSNSKEIIETLVANSTTFSEKTEFSQEKYIKKKEKKYFDYIQIRKPTMRLLAHIFYRQDPEKVLGMRIDSLSQLISYAGINSSGHYLLYDSSPSGLVTAAFLNSIGSQGDGKLLVVQPGNYSQRQGVSALNLSHDHLKKCIGINVYSVLRQYYQETLHDNDEKVVIVEMDGKKRKFEISDSDENPSKKVNIDGAANGHDVKHKNSQTNIRREKWQIENREAVDMLKEKFDSLTIVTRDDPFPIVKEFLPFIHHGRQIVIFHTCKEILMECYTSLKQLDSIINLRLVSSFMRNMQVLPKRTHPFVQIQGSSGYLLAGYTVNPKFT